ncbi:MAG: TetR/AcrR family transcriptional regulator [Rubrivivax sp.]|nr:MAG: TetR/AcrR family transcriptional regulator [Rubrivivax sp.]
MNQPVATLEAPTSSRRYGGASAEERQAQRRERLMAAAFDVFGREGYLQSTMRLINAQARLTERYFYESFATLDEAFMAVHKRLSAEVSQRIVLQIAAQPDDPVAQTRAGLRAFFEFIKEDPRRAQILLTDAVITGLASPCNLNARVSYYRDLLKERFKKRYPNLSIELDLDLIVGGFVGMIIHTSSVWVKRGFDVPVETMVDHNAYAWVGMHQWLSKANVCHV